MCVDHRSLIMRKTGPNSVGPGDVDDPLAATLHLVHTHHRYLNDTTSRQLLAS